jgi:hypothetical protein
MSPRLLLCRTVPVFKIRHNRTPAATRRRATNARYPESGIVPSLARGQNAMIRQVIRPRPVTSNDALEEFTN